MLAEAVLHTPVEICQHGRDQGVGRTSM
jgi:hypothetical protein